MAQVLIIDDDKSVCLLLSEMIKRLDHQADYKTTLQDGLQEALSNSYDVVFLDVILPDGNGLDILPKIREKIPSPEVIIMTGSGSYDGAETAIRNGAWDYLQKPLTPQKIALPLKRILQYHDDLRKASKAPVALNLEGIIGSSPKIKSCFDLLAQAANNEANVLITGETGTGKELFAKAIHKNSFRSDKQWVVIDCAAIPETLAESLIFGHEKGAFTGAVESKKGLVAQANNSTLFLDEVGELPQTVQKKFLRVLQDRRFRLLGGKNELESDFRLVVATNRDIDQMTDQGKFRRDLLYRLRTLEIHIPPLRERPEDLKDLILHYMNKLCEGYKIGVKGLSPECYEVLTSYDWPGNVRELVNTLESALASCRDEPTLFVKHLPTKIRVKVAQDSLNVKKIDDNKTHEEVNTSFPFPNFKAYKSNLLQEGEKNYLQQLMYHTKGSIKEACRISGLGRTWLYALLKKYGISRYGWSSWNNLS